MSVAFLLIKNCGIREYARYLVSGKVVIHAWKESNDSMTLRFMFTQLLGPRNHSLFPVMGQAYPVFLFFLCRGHHFWLPYTFTGTCVCRDKKEKSWKDTWKVFKTETHDASGGKSSLNPLEDKVQVSSSRLLRARWNGKTPCCMVQKKREMQRRRLSSATRKGDTF